MDTVFFYTVFDNVEAVGDATAVSLCTRREWQDDRTDWEHYLKAK